MRLHYQRVFRIRSHKGTGLVECVILMVVLMGTLWSLLSTAVEMNRLQGVARQNISVGALAASWFAALESIPESVISANFDVAAAEATTRLGGSGDILKGFQITASPDIIDGARFVTLTLSGISQKTPFTMVGRINTYSNETVANDKWH